MNVPEVSPIDPLRARFTGRRDSRRVPCTHPVLLCGVRGARHEGATLDLSRGGALVAVTDLALREGEDGITLIQARFPDGVEIVFPVEGGTRKARIVRATLLPEAQLALGCAFETPLTTMEAIGLGLVAGESGVPEASADSLPLLPRPGVALSLVLMGATESVVGPLALGTVCALGEQTIEATFGKPPDAMVASCRDEPFNTLLVVGRDRIWTGRGTLVGCRADGAGCRVRVLATEELGRSVRRRAQAADV